MKRGEVPIVTITRREFLWYSGGGTLVLAVDGCGLRLIHISEPDHSTGTVATLLVPTAEVSRDCRLPHALFSEMVCEEPELDVRTVNILRPHDLVGIRLRLENLDFGKRGCGTVLAPAGQKAFLVVEFPPQHVLEQAFAYDESIVLPVKAVPARPSRLAFRIEGDRETGAIPYKIERLLDWRGLNLSVAPAARHVRPETGEIKFEDPAPTETAIEVPFGIVLSPDDRARWWTPDGPAQEPSKAQSTKGGRSITTLWTAEIDLATLPSAEARQGFKEDQPCARRTTNLRAVSSYCRYPSFRAGRPHQGDRFQIVRLTSDVQLERAGIAAPLVAERLLLSALGATAQFEGRWNLYQDSCHKSLLEINAPNPDCCLLKVKGADGKDRYNYSVDRWQQNTILGRDQLGLISEPGYGCPLGHQVSWISVRERQFQDAALSNGQSGKAAVMRLRYYCELRDTEMMYPMIPDGKLAQGGVLNGRRWPFRRVTIFPQRTPDLEAPVNALPGGCKGTSLNFEVPKAHPSCSAALVDCNPTNPTLPAAAWMYPEGSQTPFLFEVTAEDWSGRVAEFRLPLLWVRQLIAETWERETLLKLQRTYLGQGCAEWEKYSICTVSGQKLYFVPPLSSMRDRENANGAAERNISEELTYQRGPGRADPEQALPTRTLSYDIDVRENCQNEERRQMPPKWRIAFYPAIREAEVRLDALAAFDSSPDPGRATINYAKVYTEYGFLRVDPTTRDLVNPGEVYASLSPKTAPTLSFRADRSGGLAQPSITIRELSRRLGPIGGSDSASLVDENRARRPSGGRAEVEEAGTVATSSGFARGEFDPRDFFGGKLAQLLGGIDLKDVVAPITDAWQQLEKVPALLTKEVSGVTGAGHELGSVLRTVRQTIDGACSALWRSQDRLTSEITKQRQELLDLRRGITKLLAWDVSAADLSTKQLAYIREQVVNAIVTYYCDTAGSACPDDQTLEEIRHAFDGARTLAAVLEYCDRLDGIVSDLNNAFPLQLFDNLKQCLDDWLLIVDRGDAALIGRVAEGIKELRTTFERIGPRQRLADVLKRRVVELRSRGEQLRVNYETVVTGEVARLKTRALDAIEKRRTAIDKSIDEKLRQVLEGVREPLKQIAKCRDAIEQAADQVIDTSAAVEEASEASAKCLKVLRADLASSIPQELHIDYEWRPALKSTNLFEAQRHAVPATFVIRTSVQKHLGADLAAGEVSRGPEIHLTAELKDFTLHLVPQARFLKVGFQEAIVNVEPGKAPKISVKLGGVELEGSLSFLKKLQDFLSPDTGPFLELPGDFIKAGFRFSIPAVTLGGLNLSQLGLEIATKLPFNGDPMEAVFQLCSRRRPFLVSVGILGGGGFFGLGVTPRGLKYLEGAIEFGGVLQIDVAGIVHGDAYILAGIYFYASGFETKLSGYVRAGGCLRILGLVTVTLEIYLGLGYERRGGTCYAVGVAQVSVEVEILFFSETVSFEYRKEFEGSRQDTSPRGITHAGARELSNHRGSMLASAVNPQCPTNRRKRPNDDMWRAYRRRFVSWNRRGA